MPFCVTGRCIIPCKATTLNINTIDRTRTTTGSTLSPGDSSVYSSGHIVSRSRSTTKAIKLTQHCAAASTGAGRPGAAWSYIRNLVLLVRSRSPANSSLWSAGRRRGWWASGVLHTRGVHRGWCTWRRLWWYDCQSQATWWVWVRERVSGMRIETEWTKKVNQFCLPLFVCDDFCRRERPVTWEHKWFGYDVLCLNLEVAW